MSTSLWQRLADAVSAAAPKARPRRRRMSSTQVLEELEGRLLLSASIPGSVGPSSAPIAQPAPEVGPVDNSLPAGITGQATNSAQLQTGPNQQTTDRESLSNQSGSSAATTDFALVGLPGQNTALISPASPGSLVDPILSATATTIVAPIATNSILPASGLPSTTAFNVAT